MYLDADPTYSSMVKVYLKIGTFLEDVFVVKRVIKHTVFLPAKQLMNTVTFETILDYGAESDRFRGTLNLLALCLGLLYRNVRFHHLFFSGFNIINHPV